ncbi:pathogen-related protein-like [Curcuma longa]|uniref:pathogen-related protein-like n=1 Tax=Curcuma longa TaxID=136217 RepID=UPI003D9ED481
MAVAGEDPYRSFISGEGEKDTEWRFGAPPNYDVVNRLFEADRTNVWPLGSLEERVQRMVKTWEMELSHKVRPQDFKSVNLEKFTLSVNGRRGLTAAGIGEIGGSYNAFLQTDLPKKLRIYDPEEETRDTSSREFLTTFPRGFAVEILQVYSGPPVVAYRFRHWSYMDGPFKGHAPTGELVQFSGIGIFHVDEDWRVEKVELFYERGDFLSSFLKGAPLEHGEAAGACPFVSS